jgi:signal transduction protein with GAF and PtsI domain
LEITSDLIHASEPGELGRKAFEHVKCDLGLMVCTNYRLDPVAQRLRLVFVHGIPPEKLEAAQSLELGQEYCGTAAETCQPLVADKQRIASDQNGRLARELGATAYACCPLKASDGRLLGTFAVASTIRESFTDDEIARLGTITNFIAQAWERLDAEQGLRASEERLRLSQNAYFEGRTCELAQLGYNRDGKAGKLQIVFGLLCTAEGYPVVVEVFAGNTGDPSTLASQVNELKERSRLRPAPRSSPKRSAQKQPCARP